MSKTTASIPKSRSKYLMQFLKRKVDTSHEKPSINQDNWVTIYSSISGGPHRRGNTTQYAQNLMEAEEYVQIGWGEHYEEQKESMYQTPKNYSNRRRIKKIKCDVYEEHEYSSGSKKFAFDSTEWTNFVEATKVRNKYRKDFIQIGTDMERIHQVDIGDQSIDEIDEEEEWASIPSEEKTKKEIHNEFYQKINRASNNNLDPRDDPYNLLFDQDLSINKMIDEIITNDHYMKFSDSNEHIRHEDMKEEVNCDIEMQDDNEILITPDFDLDDVVTSIQETDSNSPLSREQKKSFKYFNKYHNVCNKNTYGKVNSPLTQKKRCSNFRLKKLEPLSSSKRSELLKTAKKSNKRMSSSKRK